MELGQSLFIYAFAQTCPSLWAFVPNYVGHGCPRLWAWIPIVLVTRTHVRGHGYPCTWVRVTTYVDIIDAFRSIFRLFCMLFRLFCMMFAGFLWYFSLFYDTSMRLLWLFSEKYHSYKHLYIRYINWNFPEKWDFETFFEKKHLYVCAWERR